MTPTTTNSGCRPTLVVVLGPTGVGKTDLGIEVARVLEAPILNADSRQLYAGMSIGTAQPDPQQQAAVSHYLFATHNPAEHYSSGDYEKEALELLHQLFVRHRYVVAVGGSGLYIDALCRGLDALPQADPGLRAQLMARLQQEGLASLSETLRLLDPVYYEQVDRSNPARVLRAVEVCMAAGSPYSELRSGARAEREFDILKIGVTLPREELYRRIDLRVDRMMEAGLEAEARRLYPLRDCNALRTVGYRELFSWFDGEITREQAVELIKRNTRRYAKRQVTWFKRDAQVVWFSPGESARAVAYVLGQHTDR